MQSKETLSSFIIICVRISDTKNILQLADFCKRKYRQQNI